MRPSPPVPAIVILVIIASVHAQTPAPTPTVTQNVTNLGSDANGNPLRRALKTGHVSNYDQARVPPYTLPDPLVRDNGTPVRDATAWFTERRPEILKRYDTEIFGRVPANAPKVTWEVTEVGRARDGSAAMKRIVGTRKSPPVLSTACSAAKTLASRSCRRWTRR
jgi:hypothetical protein